MRFDTINAASYLVWRLQASPNVRLIRDDGDMILLEAQDSSSVMIYMVERGMTPQDLLFHLRENTQRQIATLMIYWVDMHLPSDGSEFTLSDWMSAMLSIQNNKIYGFEVAGREAYFFPVHFDGNGYTRHVRYGEPIDYNALQTHVVDSDHHLLRGSWRIGSFERVEHASRNPRSNYQGDSDTATPHLSRYFQVLGLHDTATMDTVKQTYYMLARRYHPDLNSSYEAHQRMKQINAAYTHILRHFEDSI
jgi:hypothetical protein